MTTIELLKKARGAKGAMALADTERKNRALLEMARAREGWLCEVGGMLRERFFRPSGADSREGVGADLAWDDGLRDDDVLLVPPPFDSLYPHYLCAMTDAALGENDRYAGEQAQYNSILAELAGWLRRNYRPVRGSRWRW